jgi:hypothetical protein
LSEKTQAIIQKGGNEDNIKGIMKKRKRSKKKLDLTATPPTQTSVEDASIVEHNPIHSLTHGGPIGFRR